MRAVSAALPEDLVPQPAREQIVPAPQLGKESANYDQAGEVRGKVVGPDRAGLLEVAGDVCAVLLEKFEEETGIDRVQDQPVGERHRHRAEADLHRARPLHAHSSGVGLLELAHGLLPGARPGWIAGEPEGLSESPELRQPPQLPHHLGVRAPLEGVDAFCGNRRVVSDGGHERVAVVVDGDAAALELAEQPQLAP